MMQCKACTRFFYEGEITRWSRNFGSIDGDNAAMRYTEVKLAKITEHLVSDINKNTVEFQNNYDDTELEPKVLPSQFPNLIVNGAGGIAVGMATNIPRTICQR